MDVRCVYKVLHTGGIQQDKARAAPPTMERDLNGSIASGVYRSTCGSWTYLWTLDDEGSAEK